MASRRDIRRLAFQALFQIDATQGEGDAASIIEATASEDELKLANRERRAAVELAEGAWTTREASDATMVELAPTWPAHRQAAVDRAILRLAHYEMTAGISPPKAVVNDAVELAKTFSTDKSPAFVNGLLDKVLKRVEAANRAADAPPEPTSGSA
ncbi:MAG: transcription antitermination factor NusB [Planctomycetota bacterium]